MNQKRKKIILTLLIACLISSIGVYGYLVAKDREAQDFERAVVAYKNGNYSKAIPLLIPLAEEGNATAQDLLGQAYAYGLGIKKDKEQAMKLLQTSAERNQEKIGMKFFYIGQGFEKGKHGITPDQNEAEWWYKEALKRGYSKRKENTASVN